MPPIITLITHLVDNRTNAADDSARSQPAGLGRRHGQRVDHVSILPFFWVFLPMTYTHLLRANYGACVSSLCFYCATAAGLLRCDFMIVIYVCVSPSFHPPSSPLRLFARSSICSSAAAASHRTVSATKRAAWRNSRTSW